MCRKASHLSAPRPIPPDHFPHPPHSLSPSPIPIPGSQGFPQGPARPQHGPPKALKLGTPHSTCGPKGSPGIHKGFKLGIPHSTCGPQGSPSAPQGPQAGNPTLNLRSPGPPLGPTRPSSEFAVPRALPAPQDPQAGNPTFNLRSKGSPVGPIWVQQAPIKGCRERTG